MRFGGIVLLALLAVGACSSDPEPKEPKPSATSATPTVSAPTMPASAKKDTPSGAANFVRHYIGLVNYAANTGDVRPMLAISSKCKPCQSYASAFEEEPADGERFAGILWTLNGIAVSRTRAPLEVDAQISAREGSASKDYTFTFVLSPKAPFAVGDIYMSEEG
jgi:hypothetical protein